MKKINFLLTTVLILGLTIYSGCGSTGTDPQDTPAKLRLAELEGTWSATAGSVTRDGLAEPAYDNFTLTISGTLTDDNTNVVNTSSYTTNDSANPAVFPSGTWAFDGTNVNSIVRGTGIKMNIDGVTESALVIEFTLNAEGTANRTSGLAGSWIFTLSK